MKPWFTVYFFDIGHPCHNQLTPVKIGHPLTSITRPNRRLKFRAGFPFTASFRLQLVIVKTENRSSNNIQKTSPQSDKTQIKILPFPGLLP